MRWLLALLLLVAAPAWAQDQELTPDGENNPTDVFADNCTTACNATTCNTDVDEPFASSDDVENKSITNNATILYDFPTPSANPDTGTNQQSIDIEVSRCDDDAGCTERTGGTDPTYTVEVYCNGSALTTPQVIQSAVAVTGLDQTATNVTFTFDTTDCAADGSDLQMLYTFGQSSGSPANRNWPCIDVIEWNVTHASGGPTPVLIVVE